MSPQVFVCDGFTQVGEVTEFEKVEVVERDLAVGNFRVQFDPRNQPALYDAVLDAARLRVEVYDPDTGRRWHGKVQQRRRIFENDDIPTLLDLRGVDHMDDLEARLEWPNPFDVTEFWEKLETTRQLSDAFVQAVNFNGGLGAGANRQITGLNLVVPTPFGPTKTWDITGRPLLEVWAPQFEGTQWTFRMRFNRTGPQSTGEIICEPVERATTGLLITPTHHPGPVEVIETAAQVTESIIVGDLTGGATPDERFVAQAIAVEDTWLEDHRERYTNRPSGSQNVINDEATDTLTAFGPKLGVLAQDIEIDRWDNTVLIGDYVTVSYSPTEAPIQAPIKETRLTGTTEGWDLRASIGTDIAGPAAQLSRRIQAISTRLNRVEGDI